MQVERIIKLEITASEYNLILDMISTYIAMYGYEMKPETVYRWKWLEDKLNHQGGREKSRRKKSW